MRNQEWMCPRGTMKLKTCQYSYCTILWSAMMLSRYLCKRYRLPLQQYDDEKCIRIFMVIYKWCYGFRMWVLVFINRYLIKCAYELAVGLGRLMVLHLPLTYFFSMAICFCNWIYIWIFPIIVCRFMYFCCFILCYD